MALNLADRIAVRPVIVGRCVAVVANYALYLLNLPGTAEQLAWAEGAIRSQQSVGETVSWYVLNQQAFIDNGSSITDQDLTGAVEAAINAHFIAQA